MKYNVVTRILMTDEEQPIKKLECPLNKRWDHLAPLWPAAIHPGFGVRAYQERALLPVWDPEPLARQRWCAHCDRTVVDISNFPDVTVQALVEVDPGVCLHCPAGRVTLVGADAAPGYRPGLWPFSTSDACSQPVPEGHTLIHTARQPEAMRRARDKAAYVIPFDLKKSARVWLLDLIEEVRLAALREKTWYQRRCAARWDGEKFVDHRLEQVSGIVG